MSRRSAFAFLAGAAVLPLCAFGFGPAQGGGSSGGGLTGPGSSTDTALAAWSGTGGDTLADTSLTVPASGTLLAPTAYVVGAATTSGIRLEVNGTSGQLELREGDDSAAATLLVGEGTAAEPAISCAADVGQTYANGIYWASGGRTMYVMGDGVSVNAALEFGGTSEAAGRICNPYGLGLARATQASQSAAPPRLIGGYKTWTSGAADTVIQSADAGTDAAIGYRVSAYYYATDGSNVVARWEEVFAPKTDVDGTDTGGTITVLSTQETVNGSGGLTFSWSWSGTNLQVTPTVTTITPTTTRGYAVVLAFGNPNGLPNMAE